MVSHSRVREAINEQEVIFLGRLPHYSRMKNKRSKMFQKLKMLRMRIKKKRKIYLNRQRVSLPETLMACRKVRSR